MKETLKTQFGNPVDWKTYKQIKTVRGRRNFSAIHFGKDRVDSYHAGERKGFLAGIHKKRSKRK
jgi:hypothetical protein